MMGLKLLIVAMLYASNGVAAVDHDEYFSETKYFLDQYGVATDNVSLLRAVEEDKRPLVRSIAADLLTHLKEPRTAPLLRARLAIESDETARAHFARDLLRLEGNAAHDLARSTLDTLKDLEARMWLAWALAESGDLAGYSDVLSGLKSGSSRVHSLAAQHLVAFVKACRGCDLKPQPLDLALSLLEDPSAAVRISAENAVTERLDDDPRSGVALGKVAATDKEELVRKIARTSLELWWRRMKKSGSGGSQ